MRGRSRQRGASAVFVAISMVASIAALGMALDLGRLYFTHRDLQVIADMAALDAARSAGGCLGQVDDPHGAAAGEAAQSVQRNGGSLAWLTAGTVEIGREVRGGGMRGFALDDGPRADSVRVVLRRPLPGKLIPMFSSGPTGVMAASTAATLRPIVSLDVASSLAEVNPQLLNNLLGRMLGNSGLDLSAASYNGLFSATVRLGDLAAAANAGSVEDFLDTQTNAPDLLNTIAGTVDAGSEAAVRTTLTALAAGSDTSHTVLPRDVLGVPAGSTADEAVVSVGALVTALAEASNGDNLIDVEVPVDLPEIGSVQLKARLIELARPAIGPPSLDESGNPQTFANTAQGLLQATFVAGRILNSDIKVSIYTQFADASAGVTDLRCSQRGRPNALVTVDAHSGLGGLGIGNFDIGARTPPTFPLPPTPIVDLSSSGIPVQIVASAHASIGGEESRILQFQGPFPAPPQTVGTDPASALALAIDNASETIDVRPVFMGSEVPLLSAVQQQVVNNAIATIKPVLANALRQVSQQVLQPAAQTLGASAGSARVRVESVVAQQPVIYAR